MSKALAMAGRRFYERGWVLGTSGNFSVVSSRDPLRLTISSSAVPKGAITEDHFLIVGPDGQAVGSTSLRPSAETLLHTEIARRRPAAGAILHTHSPAATVLSDQHFAAGGVEITGYEMLKGLAGVTTHEHREWLPIIENDQDMTRLSGVVGRLLDANPNAHGFLLRRHGLYTWGNTLADAERHVEILEFLLDVYRSR
jgi:methylthioribulose-1-phosphate dehydratase